MLSDAEIDCASEPIRVPGSIQPHGWMAILDAGDEHIVAHSENWPGLAALELAVHGLRSAICALQPHLPPQMLGHASADGQTWTCVAHRSGGLILLEFEPTMPAVGVGHGALQSVADRFAPQLQDARSIPQLCSLAALQMKELSGFGRCLVYRFDPNGHGEVLAEVADPGYASYQGHWFPASDVPAQARELYVANQFRMIPDANAVPVPLHCLDAAWTARGLDLSMAELRSVSPVHLQYMRNMETLASMSVSIIVGGRLWGMISCHNRTPLSMSLDARQGCRYLGRLLSMQMEVLEGLVNAQELLQSRKLAFQVLAGMGRSDATLEQLLQTPEPLLRLVDATGVALVHDEDCWSAGVVPEKHHLLALARQISAAGVQTFQVARLASIYAEGRLFADVASGVLAISISRVRRHVVLWFRPEVTETLMWAGDPRDKSRSPQAALSPRSSFASFYEEVRGQSRRWSSADIASVGELRNALITLVLTRAQERELLSVDLARANGDIDSFTQSMAHELRQPLISAGGFGQLAKQQFVAAGDLQGADYVERVLKSVSQISAISDTVLELARISRAAPRRQVVDISALASAALDTLQRRDPSRQVRASVQPGMVALTDPVLMKLVLAQLLDNAWKFTSTMNPAHIAVGSGDVGGQMHWWVRDDGAGFDAASADGVFLPFHRFHSAGEFSGIGAGLAIVKSAITRMGGTVRVESAPGQGATVYFTLGTASGSGTV